MDPVDPLNAPADLLSCTGLADFRGGSGVCTGDNGAIRETGTLICTPVCQVRRARRRPGPSSWAPPTVARSIWGGWRACRFRRVVNSDVRGLATAGRLFGWSGSLV